MSGSEPGEKEKKVKKGIVYIYLAFLLFLKSRSGPVFCGTSHIARDGQKSQRKIPLKIYIFFNPRENEKSGGNVNVQ